MTSAAAELVHGAVDVYTHALPDMLPRRNDDLALARECQAAGYAAIVHRNHFSPTAERSRLAADETGFQILGSILLNDSVGGVNPWVVDHELRMGAVWIGFPTLSARQARAGTFLHTAPNSDALLFGPGDITLIDDDGKLRPETAAVLRLVHEADVALHLGYGTTAEHFAVARAAAELGHERMVLTHPTFSDDELAEALTIPGLFFELSAYPTHPQGLAWADGVARNTAFIRKVGLERVVVSSDGGMSGAPSPPEILAWALDQYAAAGFTLDELRVLVHENPRKLVRF